MSTPGRYWTPTSDGRLQCHLCPRLCILSEGRRGFCFVRQNVGHEMVLTTYGRSSGFCLDPVEKKPLNHFLPGTSCLSFGTAGCNLGCKFCQNWDISNDQPQETADMCQWIMDHLGPIALSKGLHYVYTGNVHDSAGSSTWCPSCKKLLIERDWFVLGEYHLRNNACAFCGETIAGIFQKTPGHWGAKRVPVHIGSHA